MTTTLTFRRRFVPTLVVAGVVACGLFGGAATASATTAPPPSISAEEVVPEPFVERIGGADRYAVSAAISAHTFDPMVPVVYLASGEVFTDALSASAAAGAHGGAVLLTQKTAIPSVVATELRRLTPQRIIVLGGTDTISSAVENALRSYSSSVTRLSGADRYAVSAAVSANAFGSSRPVAYIASGASFPDALSGSAAAGRLGGPVLLVEKDSVPTLVADELRRLAPAKIVVLGGTNTVGETVANRLQSIATTSRVSGADRFAVSAAISGDAFPPGVPTVYVASGAVFGDALSGAAAAIANAGPVLLVSADSISAPVGAELDRLNPRRIVVLGGTTSVSDATLNALRPYLAP